MKGEHGGSMAEVAGGGDGSEADELGECRNIIRSREESRSVEGEAAVKNAET
jgi:hypothetical protein